MSLTIVGLDPGKRGFCCVLGKALTFTPAPVYYPDGDETKATYNVSHMAEIVWSWKHSNVQIVVLEEQAPRAHGKSKEGTISSWSNGRGIGLWEGCLATAGFKKAIDDVEFPIGDPHYVIVSPTVWKRRLGALAIGTTGMTDYQRRKAADEASIKAALRIHPGLDLRPVERSPKARKPSPDRACSFLLACYGRDVVLGGRREG